MYDSRFHTAPDAEIRGDFLEEESKANEPETAEENEIPELYVGMALRMLTMDNRLIFIGRIERIRRNTIQVSDDKGVNVPNVVYNTKIKMRGFYHNQAITLEGSISGSSEKFWRIENLRSLQGAEQREYFRQSANLEAMVMGANGIFGGGKDTTQEGVPVPCKIADISATGTMFKAKADYQAGDWLLLTNMNLGSGPVPSTFTCIVRRVIGEGTTKSYGCEFYNLGGSEREDLIRAIFAFQRKEVRDRSSDD